MPCMLRKLPRGWHSGRGARRLRRRRGPAGARNSVLLGRRLVLRLRLGLVDARRKAVDGLQRRTE
eukprot:8144512-Lingulodinium_polyedra.AAC.1